MFMRQPGNCPGPRGCQLFLTGPCKMKVQTAPQQALLSEDPEDYRDRVIQLFERTGLANKKQ
jgi:hypothetical protein